MIKSWGARSTIPYLIWKVFRIYGGWASRPRSVKSVCGFSSNRKFMWWLTARLFLFGTGPTGLKPSKIDRLNNLNKPHGTVRLKRCRVRNSNLEQSSPISRVIVWFAQNHNHMIKSFQWWILSIKKTVVLKIYTIKIRYYGHKLVMEHVISNGKSRLIYD